MKTDPNNLKTMLSDLENRVSYLEEKLRLTQKVPDERQEKVTPLSVLRTLCITIATVALIFLLDRLDGCSFP